MEEKSPLNTPFVHDWVNPQDRERYTFHANQIYTNSREQAKHAQHAQLEYAKWVLAAMLAVHGGSIYVISNLRTKEFARAADPALVAAATFNGWGIFFTLLTAVFAWFNFRCIEELHTNWADPAMIYRNDHWPGQRKPGLRDPINATYFLAISSGIISIWMFISSLCAVSNAL